MRKLGRGLDFYGQEGDITQNVGQSTPDIGPYKHDFDGGYKPGKTNTPKHIKLAEVCGEVDQNDIVRTMDTQIGGNHYAKLPVQPGEYAMANGLNYWQGNVVKYVTRYKDKGGRHDLEKAIDCLKKLIEAEYGRA